MGKGVSVLGKEKDRPSATTVHKRKLDQKARPSIDPVYWRESRVTESVCCSRSVRRGGSHSSSLLWKQKRTLPQPRGGESSLLGLQRKADPGENDGTGGRTQSEREEGEPCGEGTGRTGTCNLTAASSDHWGPQQRLGNRQEKQKKGESKLFPAQ